MRHVDLDAGQIAQGMAREGSLHAFALRTVYPDVEVPMGTNEVDRWCQFLRADHWEDLIITRFLSIDLQRSKGILFFDTHPGWCVEHRCYMEMLHGEDEHYKVFHNLTHEQFLNLSYTLGADKENPCAADLHHS